MERGQIWVETVIYTLIGLALIGIVLAIATPKINDAKDRALIGQSIESMNSFDEKIREVVEKGQWNVRKIDSFSLKKGEMQINSSGDEIIFTLDNLAKPYSEPGVEIELGNLKLISELGQKKSIVKIKLNYAGIANITFDGGESSRSFGANTIPYSFSFENLGTTGGLVDIDVKEVSR